MKSRIKTVFTWLLTLFLAVSFVPTGVGKFSADSGWAEVFAAWGYPAGFHFLVGALENLAAVALLVPRLTFYGAGGLAVLMAGALSTHLVHGNHPTFPAAQMAAIYLVTAIVLAYLRRDVRLGVSAAGAPISKGVQPSQST